MERAASERQPSEGGRECTICQEPIKLTDSYVKIVDCTHHFHKRCFDQGFGRDMKTCPNCRVEFTCVYAFNHNHVLYLRSENQRQLNHQAAEMAQNLFDDEFDFQSSFGAEERFDYSKLLRHVTSMQEAINFLHLMYASVAKDHFLINYLENLSLETDFMVNQLNIYDGRSLNGRQWFEIARSSARDSEERQGTQSSGEGQLEGTREH